jgi:hypothetical protein
MNKTRTRNSTISRRVFPLAVAAALALAGCAQPYVKRYEAAVATNNRNFETIRLGMTREEVEQRMGSGHLVNYKRVQLRNPWRTEAFRIDRNTQVDILYYVTQGYVWQSYDGRHAITPVVFENGKVTGWGWGYLDRNRDHFVEKTSEPAAPAIAASPAAAPSTGAKKK